MLEELARRAGLAAVIGALAAQLYGQSRDLQLKVVDEFQAGVDVAPPRIGG